MTLPAMHCVFVAPYLMPATLRFIAAAAALPDARVSLLSQDPLERLPPAVRSRLAGHWRVADCLDPAQIVVAIRELHARVAPVGRVIGTLEQLQEPLAEANAALGLPGLTREAARNFRDKRRMKDLLHAAGLPCARHAQIADAAAARAFAAAAGFPIVAKPLAGAGARNTFRLADAAALDAYLRRFAPQPAAPVLFEEFVTGTEHSFDSVLLDGSLAWRSISIYSPSALTVLENPWIQWAVLLPREIDAPRFAAIDAAAPRALAVLGLRTGMTHMEWFARPDGSIAISEVAARPPGAQFTTLLSAAHDVDFYAVWARLAIHGRFEAPQRRYAAGAAYLRGLGTGRVQATDGLETVWREFGDLIVESHWPEPGTTQPPGYEGAGYVVFRHDSTERVERALRRTVELVRVRLAG